MFLERANFAITTAKNTKRPRDSFATVKLLFRNFEQRKTDSP